MVSRSELSIAFVAVVAVCGVVGCGPNEISVDPRSVVDVKVRPASGQPLFCPGDAFQIELLTKMKDGSSCSSTDESRICVGQKGILKKDIVRVQASAGDWSPDHEHTLVPPADPLATAGGIVLKGWLEADIKGSRVKSMEGEGELKPVYQCQRERSYQAQGPQQPGDGGRDGPSLTISVTSLSTPFYPNAALVRVDDGRSLTYLLSAAADQPVRIVSRGQAGAKGRGGLPGEAGAAGAAGAQDCLPGRDGADGKNGGAAGPGGNGGNGGRFTLLYDAQAREKLEGRVVVSSEPGQGGPPGDPGAAGPGGAGGAAGAVTPACQKDPPKAGKPGRDGVPGPGAAAGAQGFRGPAPSVDAQPRAQLFAAELPVVTRIEAMPGKK